MKNYLLVYSGGMDSSSALYKHKNEIGLAVSFNYGSRHNDAEIECAKVNCKILGIKHIVIPVKEIFTHMKSSLLGSEEVPHGHYAEDNMASTVVPFRNGIMMSIAAGIAESNKLEYIMLASHKGDNAQYPDCTPDFNDAMFAAVHFGTGGKVQTYFPFADMDKREIAHLGIEFGLLPELTYSCYEGEEEHCGKCGTCVERIWALRYLDDNTMYKDKEFAINTLRESGEWNE